MAYYDLIMCLFICMVFAAVTKLYKIKQIKKRCAECDLNGMYATCTKADCNKAGA